MEAKIGTGLKSEFPRTFVPYGVDLGDAKEIDKLFTKLAAEPMKTREELESWLLKWSELGAAIDEEGSIRYIKMTCATDDEQREKDFLHFVEEIEPLVKTRYFELSKQFLGSPALKDLPEERYFVMVREIDTMVKLFRDENVPIQTEVSKLSQKYQKMMGGLTVEYQGKEYTLQQMAPFLEKQDRAVRKEVWEKVTERRLQEHEQLDKLFDEMIALRDKVARNAGFDNYRDYSLLDRGRFDYGVPECDAFHDAVAEVVVPLYRELQKKRQKDMGLDVLRPWDLKPDPKGREPLKPFTTGAELAAGCRRIYDRLDPVLGERFGFLAEHELLDLDSRKGKAPGAYCSTLQEIRYPFIFGNSVGVDHDVYTLLHESGHGFHAMECRNEPLVNYRGTPHEFSEVASMSMEFLGADHLEVFYGPEDYARSRAEHLEDVIWLFPWVATVDAFQHWIYTHPGHTAKDRGDAWLALRARFGGIESYEGYEDARRYEWHRQLHIFEYPFYYIEYGIAQIGALQIWKRAREDAKAALTDYRHGLSVGGSLTLPKLFEAAGIKFGMDRKTLEPLIGLVRKVIDEAP